MTNIIKLMRPWQWVKNLFVFVPVFACHVIKRRGRTLKEE